MLHDIEIVDVNIIEELARRTVQKFQNAVRLLRYNKQICYVNNIKDTFQFFRRFICDTFFKTTLNFEQFLTGSSERAEKVYPIYLNQIREALFDKRAFFASK